MVDNAPISKQCCEAIINCFFLVFWFLAVAAVAIAALAVGGSLAVGVNLQTHMRQAGYVLEDRVLVEFGCIAAGVLIVMVITMIWRRYDQTQASVLAWALGIVLIVIGTATLVVGLYYDIRYGFDNATLMIPAVLFSVLLWTLVAHFLHFLDNRISNKKK